MTKITKQEIREGIMRNLDVVGYAHIEDCWAICWDCVPVEVIFQTYNDPQNSLMPVLAGSEDAEMFFCDACGTRLGA